MALVFEWDPHKAASNRRKHGVSFEEAASVFADPLARIFDDPEHSSAEARELIIGHSARQVIVMVFFTDRRDAIRIISARRASKQERRDYEESLTK